MENNRQIILITSIVALFWFGMYVYFPYQTPYLLTLRITSTIIGIIIGAYGITQIVMRLPLGIIVDKKSGHKIFISTGIILVGAASLLRIIFPREIGFLIANLLSGLAASMWISFVMIFTNYFNKKNQQKAIGIIIAACNFGMLAGFIAASFYYDYLGMQFLCILSIIASSVALFLSVFIREHKEPVNILPVRKLITVYFDKRIIFFSLFAAVQQGVVVATSLSFTNKVARNLGASGWEIGIASVIYITSAVISAAFASTKYAEKWGPRFWIPAIFVVLAVYCFIIPNALTMVHIYLAQILAGTSQGILFPYCTSEAVKNVPKEKKSTALGFHQSVYATGLAFIPMLVGTVSDAFNIKFAFYLLGGLVFVTFTGVVIYGLLNKEK